MSEPKTKWERVQAAKAGDKRWCVRCGGLRIDQRGKQGTEGMCPSCRVEARPALTKAKMAANHKLNRDARNKARRERSVINPGPKRNRKSTAEAMRKKIAADPEYAKAESERKKEYNRRPEVRARLLKRMRDSYRNDPEYRARVKMADTEKRLKRALQSGNEMSINRILGRFDNECAFPGCDKPVRAKGLCNGHGHQRFLGKPLRTLQKPTRPLKPLSPNAVTVAAMEEARQRSGLPRFTSIQALFDDLHSEEIP